MNIATLTLGASLLSLAASVGTLVIAYKTSKALARTTDKVKHDVANLKKNTHRNFARMKAVITEMEF